MLDRLLDDVDGRSMRPRRFPAARAAGGLNSLEQAEGIAAVLEDDLPSSETVRTPQALRRSGLGQG
jgi:hypothetical protein